MNWVLNAFDFLCRGGPVMAPLVICSIVSITVMIERYVFFGRVRGDSRALMDRVENSLALGKYQDAARACEREQTPLGDMLACGLKCSNPRHSERCMEEHALKATPEFFKRLSSLDTIITIAPLLGLLGTVWGMINSFHVLARSGVSRPSGITAGVAEALLATATGLVIAIFTLIAFNYFQDRVKQITAEIEMRSTQLSNLISRMRVEPARAPEAQRV